MVGFRIHRFLQLVGSADVRVPVDRNPISPDSFPELLLRRRPDRDTQSPPIVYGMNVSRVKVRPHGHWPASAELFISGANEFSAGEDEGWRCSDPRGR